MPKKPIPTPDQAGNRLYCAQRAEHHLRRAYAYAERLPQLRPRIKATLKSAQGAVRHALSQVGAAAMEHERGR